ncbi:Uncharacterized protein TCAP_01080 [Tolypocladium capitatum]|uniref:FACT complex subunit n=1 Tax=Tolypocladium capitatum TaxID=45235 RepID=A0A2K3QN90_9HYPO|nr:Uncharacterized protein TCAP_01080 [Tolypocladium capitatum]
MAEFKIDSELFQKRISHFASAWKNDLRSQDGIFGGATSLLVIIDKTDEKAPGFRKNNAMHLWLFGHEFPTTLMLFLVDTLYIVTAQKKAKYLDRFKGGRFPIEVLARGKDAKENEELFIIISDKIKASGNKIGIIAKYASKGSFIDAWSKVFSERCRDVETCDVSTAVSTHAFSDKDENELRAIRAASKACVALTTPYLLDEISHILDTKKKVTHGALADRVDKKIDDVRFWQTVQLPNRGKLPSDFDPGQLYWTFGPSIQSGAEFDLRFVGDASDDSNLHAGVIITAMGLRYQLYCSAIARTYPVDPSKAQESNYKLLYTVHNTIIKEIRDGIAAKDIYARALSLIKAKKRAMEKHFLKNVGWGVGLEKRDPTLVLNAKSMRTLKDGMTLTIFTGFQGIENPRDKSSGIYSLVLTDTVRVTIWEPVVFTTEAPTSPNANTFFFEDIEVDHTPKEEERDPRIGAVAIQNITSTRLRSEQTTQTNRNAEYNRRKHQEELASKKQEEGLARSVETTRGQNEAEVKKPKRFESYRREE